MLLRENILHSYIITYIVLQPKCVLYMQFLYTVYSPIQYAYTVQHSGYVYTALHGTALYVRMYVCMCVCVSLAL